MDRRAKKIEKKRKSRDVARRKAAVLAGRKPSPEELLVRSAAREAFGPCFVSAEWDVVEGPPALVTVIVTRRLASGHLLAASALVDRTCLGVKDAFLFEPMSLAAFDELVDRIGVAHGGMERCEALVAQSLVFHALDYARSLGFEPHRDFPAPLFGPRPDELLETPWCAPKRPCYISGPRDDVSAITRRLITKVGEDGFDYLDASQPADDDDWDGDDDLTGELVHSPLERVVSDESGSLQILIYRGSADSTWTLEVQDHLGGSSVWDETFATDQAALRAALEEFEVAGVSGFLPPAPSDAS